MVIPIIDIKFIYLVCVKKNLLLRHLHPVLLAQSVAILGRASRRYCLVPGGGGGGIGEGGGERERERQGMGRQDPLIMAAKNLQGNIIALPIKMEWRENHLRR